MSFFNSGAFNFHDPMGIVADSFDRQAVAMGGRSLRDSTAAGFKNIVTSDCFANTVTAAAAGAALGGGLPGASVGVAGSLYNSFLQGGLNNK